MIHFFLQYSYYLIYKYNILKCLWTFSLGVLMGGWLSLSWLKSSWRIRHVTTTASLGRRRKCLVSSHAERILAESVSIGMKGMTDSHISVSLARETTRRVLWCVGTGVEFLNLSLDSELIYTVYVVASSPNKAGDKLCLEFPKQALFKRSVDG